MRDYYMPETPITDAVVATNADRIRAMSDEEMAKQFSHTSICEEKYPKCMEDREDCVECLLKWLKQPASEPPKGGE